MALSLTLQTSDLNLPSMSAMATGTPKCNDTIGLKMRNNRVARTAHMLVKFLAEFCKTTRKKKQTNKFRRQHEPTTVNLSIPTFTSIPGQQACGFKFAIIAVFGPYTLSFFTLLEKLLIMKKVELTTSLFDPFFSCPPA